MKVIFHHEDFDRDVSSGTQHAAYQWSELLASMGVTTAAVINFSSDPWPTVTSSVTFELYSTYAGFLAAHPGETVLGTSLLGNNHYRGFDYSSYEWLYVGGTMNTETFTEGVSIPTSGSRELYPREAAAIILSEVKWQLP